MTTIFDTSPTTWTQPLLLLTLAALVALLLLGARNAHLARIAVRNVPRRKLRTALIIFGLMLGTTFIAAAFAVDDAIALGVRTIAVYNLGRIDEEVLGGDGPLSAYSEEYGARAVDGLRDDPQVAGVAPALLVQDLLLADETSGQVRGRVGALAMDPQGGGALVDLRAASGNAPTPIDALAPDEVYLNRNAATLLNAHAGDALTLYSSRWPGKRYSARVREIVTGGPLGDAPSIVLPLATLQRYANAPNQINRIYIANAGDGLTGVARSDGVSDKIYVALYASVRSSNSSACGSITIINSSCSAPPVDTALYVHKAKQDGVRFALQAQEIFGRILTLFTLFALAIGLLLIFLIFTLLAAERRAELGMARALGMRRLAIAQTLLFEGAAYNLAATLLGLLAGLGLGAAIVMIINPVVARTGYPLKLTVDANSMAVAFCLGLLFTLATILLAAWTVSRMTVAAALRDLPEPPAPQPSLVSLVNSAFSSIKRFLVAPGVVLRSWGTLLLAFVTRGPAPLLLGLYLLQRSRETESLFTFSLGLSFALVGLALLLRALALAAVISLARRYRPGKALRIAGWATLLADRLTALVVGGGLALYWALPFDTLQNVGLPRFSGGIEVFFVAGVMMVLGAVLALAPNLDLLLAPAKWLLSRLGRLRHVTFVALVYPAFQRFRTGIGLALFSLVCFTMVVMACIAASATQSYDNLPAQAANYDIAGQPLFSPVGGLGALTKDIHDQMPDHGAGLSAISSATPLPLGIIQPGAQSARWGVYPASQVDGAFLDGVGLPLVARAPGFASDADVWRAVREHPGNVVIDMAALSRRDAALLGVRQPGRPQAAQYIGPPVAAGIPGLSSLEALQSGGTATDLSAIPFDFSGLFANDGALNDATLRLQNIALGPGSIAPTTLWVADIRGGAATKLTVVGIVDNARGQRYGLLGSPQTFAPVERGLAPFGNEYYYFKLALGAQANQQAYALGAALRAHGFETTVIQDVLLDLNGPRVYISRVLVGLVGLTLLVGMAALAVTGSRAVVERRQQIGMMRALGFRRLHVQLLFLIESLLVGVVGTALGLVLGLILCQNIFAVDFFSQFQSGLTLVVPWAEIAVICAAALGASLVAALLPAWQAG
ncbi:MAG TPA: FtsX-like permease family protein, partial [Ktedonobacterales bacterium]